MARVSLTDRFVQTVRAKKVHSDFFDSKTAGLGLRVSPHGHKSWSVIFTSPSTGKRARLSLRHLSRDFTGRCACVGIEAKGKVEAGTDPRTNEAPATTAMTVADLIASY